jgi:hypothetical protein
MLFVVLLPDGTVVVPRVEKRLSVLKLTVQNILLAAVRWPGHKLP